MALLGRIRDALNRAKEGARDFLDRYFNEDEPRYKQRLNDRVADLRRIPADDARKKEALANYFQTPDGDKYTRQEREQAYNDLLGRERNKEHRG